MRRTWVAIGLAFVLGLLLGTQLHAATPCIALQVRPRFLIQRGDVTVQARIQKHADHRAFLLQWDSDTGSAGSSGPLTIDGANAAPLWTIRLPEQPVGHYTFVAKLFDAGGRAEIATPDREGP